MVHSIKFHGQFLFYLLRMYCTFKKIIITKPWKTNHFVRKNNHTRNSLYRQTNARASSY